MDYLLAAVAWLLALGCSLVALLALRRRARGAVLANAGLSLWVFALVVTLAELGTAFFADWSDAFNTTTISRRWFERHIETQKNETGLRDAHAFRPQLPRGRQRVAFFGDSFTIGHGIEAVSDRFSDRVARRLQDEFPNRFEVDNFGTPGFGISQIDARIRALVAAGVRLDYAVYVFTLNDIEDYHPGTQAIIRAIGREEPQSFLLGRTYLVNWLYVRVLQARGAGTADYFGELERAYAVSTETGAWQHLSRDLRALWRDLRKLGVEPIFVVFPFVHDLPGDYRFAAAHRKLSALAREAAVPVVDLEPLLAAEARRESLVVNRFDPHPNERAHELAARAIGDRLIEELRSPSAATRRDR